MSHETLKIRLQSLENEMKVLLQKIGPQLEKLDSNQRPAAANLVEYLVLRSHEMRDLQDELHVAGLSSLASSESHILRQIQSIQERLGRIYVPEELSPCTFNSSRAWISHRSRSLFGPKSLNNIPYLMVTFDTNFADNYQLVKKLLENGMNVARINCAHDNEEIWKNMIDLVHLASEKTHHNCKIYMDLAGPKLRVTLIGQGRSNERVAIDPGFDISLVEKDADFDPTGIVLSCGEERIVPQLKNGDRVLFDDGIIEGVVTSNKAGIASVRIVRVSGKRHELRTGKGINFPDTELSLPPLTQDDIRNLDFICRHSDMVGYSFVRYVSDLVTLQAKLAEISVEKKPNIILKIETARAVDNLPLLLLQAMKDEVFGVMIARGDLAVEIGFERLSEIQEEILWISEAAHAPVIWATQVLETLNKKGVATRSEITDASFGIQSECVMINKGDHVITVLNSLTDILQRSGGHHIKKRYTFRPMQIARNFFTQVDALQ